MTIPPGKLVYFGDSLTDDHNLQDLCLLIVDPSVIADLLGPTGALSNGPTHASQTADLLGVEWHNYAVIAAEVDGVQEMETIAAQFALDSDYIVGPDSPDLDTDINLAAQIDRYLEDMLGQDLSDTTAMMMIGANDYNNIDLEARRILREVRDKLDAVIAGIMAEAVRLAEAGVEQIMIMDLPPVSFLAGLADFNDANERLADAVFKIHNRKLELAVEKLADTGVLVEVFDTTTLAHALVEDPEGFGFIAPFTALFTDPEVAAAYDADQIFAWDNLHPTTAVHAVIAAANAFSLAGGTTTRLNNRSNIHEGGDTNDLIAALGGADTVHAGAGDDIVLGGSGNDTLYGEAGDDLLSGGSGRDRLYGGAGNDILGGGPGNDRLVGDAGDDVLIDGLGSDVARGGIGNDIFIHTEATLIGGTPGDSDTFHGGPGDDELILVLSSDSYAALATDLEGEDPTDALASLGITITGIETITVIEGRHGIDAFAGEWWYAAADDWGLM